MFSLHLQMETRVQALEQQIQKEKEEAQELLQRQRIVCLPRPGFILYILSSTD